VVPLDDERLWYRYHHLLPGIGDAAAGAMNTRPKD
jgi:ATP/maltotriose-dependent transcriptional regulator MalT